MKYPALIIAMALIVSACSAPAEEPTAAFVTYLGNDTLAVEQFSQLENNFTADVILRTPETSLSRYSVLLDEYGGIQSMTHTVFNGDEGFEGPGDLRQRIEKIQEGEALFIRTIGDDGAESDTVEYEQGTLPFIDMVHWPYELALQRSADIQQDTVHQPLLTGSRLSDFIIAKIEADSMTIRHPFRGVMGVDVNDEGQLIILDAGLTTRKLIVERTSSLDMQAIGQRFKAGGTFGELSGAVEREFTIGDTNFRLTYGSPEKRGRTLFGGIVPWGQRWRTGANAATHFYTSSDIVIGDLEVPAGEYTLFTIPEPDGGTLIINQQTGQNGQTYDPERDLGRVSMEYSEKEEITEAFTINIEETGEGGTLQLVWGESVFSVDFEIQ